MIGLELDEAVARVADVLEVQGKMRGLDPAQVKSAIELWESIRAEAVVDRDESQEVQVMLLDEAAQVAIHTRCERLGGSIAAWVAGWLSQYQHQIGEREMDLGLDDLRMFARAKVGTEIGIALVKGLRLSLDGEARIDPKYFNVSLFEGSVIADEDEFTIEEEMTRRARWCLRYILATQNDRKRYASTLLLDDLEAPYVEQLVESIEKGETPSEEDMNLLAYLMSKLQPNNRYFGTTAGIEELWVGQVKQVLAFLRDFPTMDTSVLQELEVRMVEGVRDGVAHLLDDPTLGGALHPAPVDGKCPACDLAESELEFRPICDKDARDQLETMLPLGALPDIYYVQAALGRAASIPSGQEVDE